MVARDEKEFLAQEDGGTYRGRDRRDYLEARDRISRLGDKALDEFKKEYLALAPEDRPLLLEELYERSPYWPIFTPAAGEFLADQMDALGKHDQCNAAYIIAQCGYKPAVARIRKLYGDVERDFQAAEVTGVALLLLGDQTPVPRWVAVLLGEDETGVPMLAIQWLCKIGAGKLMLGPINDYLHRARPDDRGIVCGQVGASVLGRKGLKGDYKNAIKAYRDFIVTPAGKKMLAHSWMTLGEICYNQNRPDLAQRCFEERIKFPANSDLARVHLARSLRTQGKMQGALLELSSVLAASPDYTFALQERAWTYSMLGRYVEARKDIKSALKLEPDDVYLLATLAEIAAKEGKMSEARRVLKRVKALDEKVYQALLRRNAALQQAVSGKQRR